MCLTWTITKAQSRVYNCTFTCTEVSYCLIKNEHIALLDSDCTINTFFRQTPLREFRAVLLSPNLYLGAHEGSLCDEVGCSAIGILYHCYYGYYYHSSMWLHAVNSLWGMCCDVRTFDLMTTGDEVSLLAFLMHSQIHAVDGQFFPDL